MPLSRREFLATVPVPALRAAQPDKPKRTGLGVAQASYSIRGRTDAKLREPLAFLEFGRERGAGGVQLPIPTQDAAASRKLRTAVEASGLFLEGSVRMPRDKSEVERFETAIHAAKEAGVTVVRTVLLSGRRYETFNTAEDFRRFDEQSRQSLAVAEPVLAKHQVRLAIENHKDYRADELAERLKKLASEFVGACVDTGNNLALLEDPLATVETLAPLAVSVHLKDMAVQEYDEGFLLAEVPLGEGFLDLKRIVGVLRKAKPAVRFCLEMITRDPLKVPCLTPKYWATFGALPGEHLAQTLALVRRKRRAASIPKIAGLSVAEQIRVEDENVRRSLAFAAAELSI